jgi:hypothetical protein
MFNTQFPDTPIGLEDIRLRNPKMEEFGEVMNDNELVENYYLFDDKEIFLQIVDRTKTFECLNESNPNNAYHILIREWNPETWQLGQLYEVKIDKMIYASKFTQFLADKVFTHISADNISCCKL